MRCCQTNAISQQKKSAEQQKAAGGPFKPPPHACEELRKRPVSGGRDLGARRQTIYALKRRLKASEPKGSESVP